MVVPNNPDKTAILIEKVHLDDLDVYLAMFEMLVLL